MYEVSKKNIIKNLLINFTISIVLLGFLAIALITIKSGGALFMTSPFFVIIMALINNIWSIQHKRNSWKHT